jgi:hypothetical protein
VKILTIPEMGEDALPSSHHRVEKLIGVLSLHEFRREVSR